MKPAYITFGGIAAAAMALLAGCSPKEITEIIISNPTDLPRRGEMVEISHDRWQNFPATFRILDAEGNEIPFQICSDSTLIFQADVDASAETSYRVEPVQIMPEYQAAVAGRVYPERADDLSWENDLVGFRAYGPATQAKQEKAFGYDLFFKYPDKGLVLELLYEPETSPATWKEVDSLRNIDPALADDFISSFSYHIDHGMGMDCYPVGPTLGAGVAALTDSADNIVFPWCYDTAEVLDNGPLRFRAHLVFKPAAVDNDSNVIEHRLITLDRGTHLNTTSVWYENLSAPRRILAGVPRRDESTATLDNANGFITYADPTDRREGNIAMLGLILPEGMRELTERDGHIVAVGTINPTDTLTYRWGFTWPKSDIRSMEEWNGYMQRIAAVSASPLIVNLK